MQAGVIKGMPGKGLLARYEKKNTFIGTGIIHSLRG
jgi:hypothetical protein